VTIYSEEMEEPIQPLHVVVDRSEEIKSADYGSWQNLTVTPTFQPQQLLPQSYDRLNAYIFVSGSATGFVRLGSRAQIMNNTGGQFYSTVGGNSLKYESTQEVWIGSDGTTASINVMTLDHRYK